MKNNLEDTELKNVDFHDFEGISYFRSENELRITIRNWRLKIIDIVFSRVVLFVDWGDQTYLSRLCINNSKTDFVTKATNRFYVDSDKQVPNQSTLKLYQFVDSVGNPSMEIICAGFSFRVYSDSENS